MSKTKKIVIDAMFVAMYVALSLLSINLGNMKITLDGLPIIICAALFGPVDGLIVGLLGSFLNQLLTYGITATTALWMIPAGVRGLIIGLYAKRKGYDMTLPQSVMIVVISSVAVTALNTAAMWIDSVIYGYFSYAYVFGALVMRLLVGIGTAVVFGLLTPLLLRALKKSRASFNAPAEKKPEAPENAPEDDKPDAA